MFHWKAKTSYIGKSFFGSQKQKKQNSIQEEIEKALTKIFQVKIFVQLCGRTDSGVNAFAQTISFNLKEKASARSLQQSLNCLTHNDISIFDLEQIEEKQHARFDCIAKSYSYLFYSGNYQPYLKDFFYRLESSFNENLAQKSCQIFYGENNFNAIIVNNQTKQNPIRNILLAKLIKISNSSYAFVICADGFMYKMVRSLAGLLLATAQEKMSLKEVTDIIKYNNPQKLKLPISPAHGLSFFEAYYNENELKGFLKQDELQLKQKIIKKILP